MSRLENKQKEKLNKTQSTIVIINLIIAVIGLLDRLISLVEKLLEY